MIELLIKMADSLDSRGFYAEASKVDRLIKKIAATLEYDRNFTKECSDCASRADDADDVEDMTDNLEDFAMYTDEYENIDYAYDKVLEKRRKSKKKKG